MTKQNNIGKIIYFFVSIIFLIGFNFYLSSFFSGLANPPTLLFSGLRLNYMENTGAAFSILQDCKLFLIFFAVCSIVLILWYLFKNIFEFTMIEIYMIALLLSGISCNLYERIAFGFVRDYFEITFINFPIFNISDIFINISVIVIMYLLFKKSSKHND